MNIIFILVEPSVPENIGATARAINTMGHRELRLVNTQLHTHDKALWLAHGSKDILENAKIYSNLSEAITDIDFIIGTTAKNRSVKLDYYTPEQALHIVREKKDSVFNLAIVFGREESGLTNEELQNCDLAVSIPLKRSYPSLNLAQAVMIMSYVFSDLKINHPTEINKEISYAFIKKRVSGVLDRLELSPESNLHGRILERLAILTDDDLRLILSILQKAETRI